MPLYKLGPCFIFEVALGRHRMSRCAEYFFFYPNCRCFELSSRRQCSEEEYTTDETSEDEEEEPTPTTVARKSKPPRRWQPSEDRRLAESVKQHGEANWKAIAAKVGSRNHVQCLQRWKKVQSFFPNVMHPVPCTSAKYWRVWKETLVQWRALWYEAITSKRVCCFLFTPFQSSQLLRLVATGQ